MSSSHAWRCSSSYVSVKKKLFKQFSALDCFTAEFILFYYVVSNTWHESYLDWSYLILRNLWQNNSFIYKQMCFSGRFYVKITIKARDNSFENSSA